MTAAEWFELRARLSHDLLQNKVLTAIRPAPGSPEGAPSAVPFLNLFLARVSEVRELLRGGPAAVRPGSWLVSRAARAHASVGGDALREFLDLDFERTSGLPRRCKELEVLLGEAEQAVRDFLAAPEEEGAMDRARGPLTRLSDGLQGLPSDMLSVVETMM